MGNARKRDVNITMKWWLIQDRVTNPHRHFAVEEALLRLMAEGKEFLPILRLRRFKRSVWIGIFQDAEKEVNVAFCRKNNIPIVRRPNPGGAVFQDENTFCYSAFFRPRRDLSKMKEEEYYRIFGDIAIQTCRALGIKAHFRPLNDVLVGERKIYGSAQIALYDAFVQSGSFLVDIDLSLLSQVLTPPREKFADKKVKKLIQAVTTLSRELERDIKPEEVIPLFIKNFQRKFKVNFVSRGLNKKEMGLAEELLRDKYGREEWNLGRRKEYEITVSEKSKSGVVFLTCSLDRGRIRAISIYGDFLLSKREKIGKLCQRLLGKRISQAAQIVKKEDLPLALQETIVKLLKDLPG